MCQTSWGTPDSLVSQGSWRPRYRRKDVKLWKIEPKVKKTSASWELQLGELCTVLEFNVRDLHFVTWRQLVLRNETGCGNPLQCIPRVESLSEEGFTPYLCSLFTLCPHCQEALKEFSLAVIWILLLMFCPRRGTRFVIKPFLSVSPWLE